LADIDDYCAMEMDSDVRRYVGGRPRTREEAEKRFNGTLQAVKGNLNMWATILKSGVRYIGRCGIYPHFNNDGNPISGEASLGLYIAKEYWNKGFATEAGRAFIAFGFLKLGLHRIVTAIDTRNAASVKVVERLGMELTYTETGESRSFFHYAINRDRYYEFSKVEKSAF